MKVLIVDDNLNDRKLLRMILERHQFKEIIEAGDGLEGIEKAKEIKPDLIISDALMPRMDGFQFLRMLKVDEVLRLIPFFFYSATYTGEEEERLARCLGADGFIIKPKEPEEFMQEISAILEGLKEGKRKPPSLDLLAEEGEYLRKYSEIVAAKLEEKLKELEKSLKRSEEAEEALRKSERFLNGIIENIPDMVFVKEAGDLRFVLFNKAGEELLGYSREELIGRCDHDFFPPEEADFFTSRDREVINTLRMLDIREESIRTRDGDMRILHTKKITIPDETGTPRYLLGISEDITERRRSEDELLKLSAMVEQSPVSIVITDSMGRIEYVNPKFAEKTGYSQEEARVKNRVS